MRHPHEFRHTPHTLRGPIGSSKEGPSGTARLHHPRTHTFTRFAASEGAPPKTPVAAFAYAHRAHFGTPIT
eukprot:1069918-Pyramimonas_sp.AAC.1